MVKFIEELDKKHWEKAYPAYHPNPMGFRLGTFHGEPVSEVKVGGGSHPEKYLRSGNSPSYPPMNMHSGMAVSSGGARYSGVDGAVGGGINPFVAGYDFGHDVLGPALFGRGRGRGRPKASVGGGPFDFLYNIGRDAGKPFEDVPEMVIRGALGLGRKPRAKKGGINLRGALGSVANTIKDPAQQIAKELFEKEARKRLGLGRKGGKFNLRGALGSVADTIKEPAKQIGKELFEKEARKRLGLGRKGGKFNLLGALGSVANTIKDPAIQIAKELGEKEARKRLGLGRGKAPASRGRNVRAEIVKKVMRERGVKMIEASKIVKAEGLY
jgi:hypothetical protein